MLIKQGKDYDKAHIFEVYVIRCLCKIYGDLNIINPYRIGNENSFKSNLIMYGLKVTEMEEFISLMNDYSKWLNSEKQVGKTEITVTVMHRLHLDDRTAGSRHDRLTKRATVRNVDRTVETAAALSVAG